MRLLLVAVPALFSTLLNSPVDMALSLSPGELAAQDNPIAPSELRVFPRNSAPDVDRLIDAVEVAYASMDVERFVAFFSDDFVQLDPNRRVRLEGKDAWRAQTVRINGAHRSMGRQHFGRLWADPWLIVEIEWWGTVRGEALGATETDREYRYSGIGLIEIRDGKIRRQILWGDFATLREQLEGVAGVGAERE